MQLLAPSLVASVTVDCPKPESLAPGQVLVRVSAAAICGSDIPHFRRGKLPNGRALGVIGYPLHEIMGDVLATRSSDFGIGQPVVGWAAGMDGLAEIVITDAEQLASCDLDIPPWEAVLAQPLACVLSAIARLGDLAGKNVAVIGLGAIGLMFSHVMKHAGARTVTGIDPVDRKDVASNYGVTHFVHGTSSGWVENLDEASRVDIVIEAVGHQPATLRDAIAAAAVGGTVYCFGIPAIADYQIDLTAVVRNNLTVAGGITLDRRRFLQEACRYMAANPNFARALVTHVIPMDNAQYAYELASSPACDHIKVVLVPPDIEPSESRSDE